jgi:predicted anti-sigma-YlaC factor YlaD
MMDMCKKCKEKLLDYLEHQLSDIEHREIEEHLQQCSSCQKEYHSLTKLYGILDRDEVILPEAQFFDDLKLRLRQKDITPHRSPVWKIARVLVPVAVAAVILLLVYWPSPTTEISVPVADLLEDRNVAQYALSRIVDDELVHELTEVEDQFLFDIDEVLDEFTDEQKEQFIKILYEKYGMGT